MIASWRNSNATPLLDEMVKTVESGWNAQVWCEIKTIIAAAKLQRSAPAVRLAVYCVGNAAVTIAGYLVCGADCHAAIF